MYQKKILVAFDGLHYTENSSWFAIQMAKSTNSLLVGVFLHDLRYLNLTYSYGWDMPIVSYPDVSKIEKENKLTLDNHIKQFSESCNLAGIQFKIHRDSGVPLQALLEETTFSDLLIIDSHTSYFRLNDSEPASFLKDLLIDAHCPIIIIPGETKKIEQVILSYDGLESSVFAIKQFAYLFSEWSELKTVLISVNNDSSNHLKQNRNIKDLIERHYKDISYQIMHGDAITQLHSFIKQMDRQAIVVMGSFGRSAVSRFFSSSVGNKILQDLKTPLFIAHR